MQRFVPDLAVEIASESDSYDGLLRKKERYRRAGTAEVWLISVLNHEIAIYTEQRDSVLKGGDVLSTELLPGFGIGIDDLFVNL